MTYRIRESDVHVCDGVRCWRERKFIAEKRVSTLFGLVGWWWPSCGDWRSSKGDAMNDIDNDTRLSNTDVFYCVQR